MSNVQVLVACMHQKDDSLYREMNLQTDAILANQCDEYSYKTYDEPDGSKVELVSTATRGVGVNRNFALMYASADICLLADDDVVYCDNYEETIIEFYRNHPDADVVIFNFVVTRNGSEPRNIINKTQKLKSKKLSFGTYAISVRRSAIEWHNIFFHRQFGGGTAHSCGEDSMFLNDCFDKGLTVYVCDKTLGKVNHKESTWFDGYTDKYFVDKGVLFYSLVGWKSLPIAVYHCIKHRKEYSEYGWVKAFFMMKAGIKTAKNNK